MATEVTLRELGLLFVRLGFTAFGGPAAHIALMEEEFVERRAWIDRTRFLDLTAITNLIPGPNSTELALHLGYILRSWPGLLIAGVGFIGPAVLMTLTLAWLYATWGAVPAVDVLLVGIKPAVLVIILAALIRLGRSAIKSFDLAGLGATVAVTAWWGLDPVLTLLGAGLAGMLWLRVRASSGNVFSLLIPAAALSVDRLVTEPGSAPPGLLQIALYFLKVGSVLFGSGYVLVAYLEDGLVSQYGWISSRQLMDAIAMGQVTPGPILTTATFAGYLIAGWKGALVATLAIFLPSFVFVVIIKPLVPRLRRNPWAASFLDAVNVAAVALMAVVLLHLGEASLQEWQDWLLLAISAWLLFRLNVPGPLLILIAALAGWGLHGGGLLVG